MEVCELTELSAVDLTRDGRRVTIRAVRPQDRGSAVIVLVENFWERKFREPVPKHSGSLISQGWYGADSLARLGERLAASGQCGRDPAA